MNQFLRVGRSAFGTGFRVNYLWLAVLAALGTATAWYVSERYVSEPGTLRHLLSVGGIVALFAGSLVVHEYGHSWVDRRIQTGIYGRSLHLLGSNPIGFNNPETPGIELRYAIAGPVASLLTGLIALLPVIVLPDGSGASTILIAAGITNLLIGGINLLPVVPLDGGYVLRSIFWYLQDSHVDGSRFAYFYSQFIASIALGIGIVILAWRQDLLLLGLWLTAFAWMSIRGARIELQRSTLIDRATAVRAADGIAGLNPTIRAAATVDEAVDILLEQHGNGPGLVRDRNRFVGTLTLAMIREIPREQWGSVTVREAMVPIDELRDSEPGATLVDVLRLQYDGQRRTVVVRHVGGEIAGLVSPEIAPRTLLRRAEDRSVERVTAGEQRESPPGS